MRNRRRTPYRDVTHFAAALLIIIYPLVTACVGVAEGVTRAFIESGGQQEPLQCEITGPPFEGIEGIMLEQKDQAEKNQSAPSESVKVMLVHGMGSPEAGYSARLQENLTRELGLTVRTLRPKKIGLRSARFDETPLGTLTVWRYRDEAAQRELLFYELTWSEIVKVEKDMLAYDTSGQYSYKRAMLNDQVKQFLNTRLSDPVIYLGKSHDKILEAVTQGHCWMFYLSWDELPSDAARACSYVDYARADDLARQQFVFITHSMGSRVLVDAFHRDVQNVEEMKEFAKPVAGSAEADQILHAFQEKEFRVFMMANQLPLMQLGRDAPSVVGERAAYCRADGGKFDERMLSRLSIVAFTDPNDVLSYGITPTYDDEFMDSRLCPSITNVILNITPVLAIFKLGNVADPFKAHDGYDKDERVIGLMVGGIGTKHVAPDVSSGCRWTRTVDE